MKKADGNYKNGTNDIVIKILIYIFGITALFLFFPSINNLPVFSKGEFAYPESLGYVFAFLTILILVLFLLNKKIVRSNLKSIFLKNMLTVSMVAAGIFLLLIVISFTWIRFGVKSNCQNAQRTYGGDCVSALSALILDQNQSYHAKNSAINALGQLADKRALPILKKYYTGKIPNRESLYKTISQYELKKAIKWSEEGNITSWMYWDHNNWR